MTWAERNKVNLKSMSKKRYEFARIRWRWMVVLGYLGTWVLSGVEEVTMDGPKEVSLGICSAPMEKLAAGGIVPVSELSVWIDE